ncbi:MAG: hypothetical protein KF797_14620, partial [Flavobacteriales bacterium]|nr:hypothetical protein [Flavobacteriales bacterium]
MKHLYPILFLAAAFGMLVSGCRKDAKFTDEAGIELEFSRDTVMFDTIFTTVGSVTKRFVARNPHRNAVRVQIALEGGSPSPFRINVDGATGISFSDVEILGGDSIFIFVEATLDQGNQSNPFVIEDHIRFSTNGTAQEVLLVAWGRNAVFHYPGPDSIQVNGLPRIGYVAGGYDPGWVQRCETVYWTAERPHVVYGYAVVDSCSTLIIEAGTNIHFHNGAGLWVYHYGQIKANGDPDQPIIFQGDRLEPFYAEVPGQWDRIWINEGSSTMSSVFINVLIKNALVGIQCENVPWLPEEPTSAAKLILDKVRIRNCSAAGILSRNYTIEASNLLVGDCGQYGVALTGGGDYTFEHFTIANYWNYEIRQTPAFYMNNVYADINNTLQVREVRGRFQNGIIYGSNENEFQFEFNDQELPTDLFFNNTLARTTQSTSGSSYFDASTFYRNQSPGFVDVAGRNFHLTAGSFARGRAVPLSSSAWDLDNVP